MEEPCYRPTYTLKDDVKNGWNPAQVRLYGLLPEVDLARVVEMFKTIVTITPNKRQGEERAEAAPIKSALQVSTEQGFALLVGGSTDPDTPLSIGIIFGYAFEGQYYDLPKPKIMIIPANPRDQMPPDDSGYDKKTDYKVWAVDKLDVCTEVEVSQGFIEQIVLEANLPGRRSPATYRAQVRMAHRGGRLTE